MAWSKISGFGTKDRVVLILIFIVIPAVISIFNSFFYTSRSLQYKAEEIGRLFEDRRNFARIAKELLSVRPDIVYLRLLDENGTLVESFGGENKEGTKKFRLHMGSKYTIIMGLREVRNKNLIFYSLLWSMVIGGGAGIFVIFLLSSNQSAHIERVISAMKRASRGDLSTRLDVDKSMQNNTMMIRLFESFNQLVDQLRKREETVKDSSRFQPTVVASIIKDEKKLRRVTAFVAKISNFSELSTKLSAAEFSSFLTEYRKAASSIVSDYSGVIEALVQDEIVALFNVPDEQDKPELRAVCAGVEVLQVLANMNKKRKIEAKDIISGKIGIDVGAVPFYIESDIPQSVKEIIGLARRISEEAPLWKVVVSPEIYKSLSDHVDAKELAIGEKILFSVVGVEEKAIEV